MSLEAGWSYSTFVRAMLSTGRSVPFLGPLDFPAPASRITGPALDDDLLS